MPKYLYLLSFCLGSVCLIAPQNTTVAQVVHPITPAGDDYSGDGMTWIMDRAEGAQFVLFGEQHGVGGIAEFVASVYASLRASGFPHLALEMDGWTSSMLDCEGVESFIQRYPFAIAFDADGDLDLIAQAIDQDAACSGTVLWGLDQMVTAIHPFERLAAIAPGPGARRLARGAALKSTLKMGEYLREEHFRDLEALERALGDDATEEATMIVSDLATSMEIYTKWRAGARGEIPTSVSPALRETMMKDRLDAYLLEAAAAIPLPRAVFKMGGAHTMYGVGPNGVETLGEHARQRAVANGQRALSIGIRSFRPDSGFPAESAFESSDMILIDVQEYLVSRQSDTTLAALPEFDDQFDALIYLKDAPRAARTRVQAAAAAYRQAFIGTLAGGAALALVLLSALFTAAWLGMRRKLPARHALVPMTIGGLLAVAVFVWQLLAILSYPDMSARVVAAGASTWIFLAWAVVGVYLLLVAARSWKKPSYGTSMRIYLSILSAAFVAFCWFAWHFNIGGMLAGGGSLGG